MPERFKQVSGGVFRGGEPSEVEVRNLIQVKGIRHFVSLDENIAAKIRPWIEKYGRGRVQHTVIPLTVSVGDAANVRYLRNNIRQILNSNQPVYVHCKLGKDRTGLAIALYNVQARGWDCERALADAKSMGFGVGVNPAAVELYEDAICPTESGEDPNDVEVDSSQLDDDVVWLMRDWFDAGNVPPAFAPQQSFAPEFPVMSDDPTTFSPFSSSDSVNEGKYHEMLDREMQKAKRRFILNKMLQQAPEQMVQPGQYDNYAGIRGVGPVETGGGGTFGFK